MWYDWSSEHYPSSGRVLNAKPDIYLERVEELLEHFQ